MPETKPHLFRRLLAPLASLKLTVVLISLAMLLIYAGTWAQIDLGIWQVQKGYFHSLFAWVPFQIFLPRHWAVPGGFPMPGGYLIGVLLLANLLAAHILRFKCTRRDLFLVPLLALMIVPLVMWQYGGTDWLFNAVRRIGLDFDHIGVPFFVWVVLLAAVVGLPFYALLFVLHGKRGGVIMIHLGLIMLLVGEGITSGMQRERQMQIDEGSYANFVQDTRTVELAVVDNTAADHNEHVVIPASLLAKKGTVKDTRLPFEITVDDFFPNSDIAAPNDTSTPARATTGSGVNVPVFGRRLASGTDAQTTDLPSAYVTLSKDGKALGTYLVTVMELAPRFAPINAPQKVAGVDGKNLTIQLRFKREYTPYTVHLIDFVHDRYTGTDVPKDFASLIRLVDPRRHEDREVRIWMNHPLRYRGETFFQGSFKPGDRTTILLVVKNPAMVFPYAACTITALGLLIHFVMMLANFLRKRATTTGVAATPPPRRPKSQRQAARPLPATPDPAYGIASQLFPIGSALLCLIIILTAAIPRSARDNTGFDLEAFGSLPVSFNGRVLPFDSLARNSIKFMRGKESLTHEEKSVDARKFLLDVFTDHEPARDYKVFRIDHPDVKSLLGLKDEDRYFSLNDMRAAGAKFDEQFQKVRDLPKGERNTFHNAIADLGERVQVFMTLSRIDLLHAAAPTASQKEWMTLGDAIQAQRMHGQADANAAVTPVASNPSADAFVRLVQAYNSGDAATFNRAVADYRAAVAPVAPRAVTRAGLETWYNSFSPFFLCAILYVVVFILAACSWLGWTRPFARAARWTLFLTFAVHTVGIVTRIYLSGRAPVTNLESSAIFIGWFVVLLGIVLELIYRNGIGSVMAAVIGFLSLTIYINLAKDDTMKVLQAVLDTNFWLWTHVPCITIGYAATFVAWGLGVIYVVLGLFTRRLDDTLRRDLARMIYGITCFAVLFSFVGTILGGIWADQSWGRFWGWDPKENGAVLIVLANVLLLHARWAGIARERGVACLAIFGGIVTSWSWFGTNMLGVGLHSYGFMDAAQFWLFAFVVTQAILIALGNIPLHVWRSYADPLPAARAVRDAGGPSIATSPA